MNHHIKYPEGHTLLRNLDKSYPIVSHGKGMELFDTSGNRYLDVSSGAMVVSLGHGNTEIIDAINRQMLRVAYVNGQQFTSSAMEDFSNKLSEYGQAIGLDKVIVLSSGSEAVEAAIKLARQIAYEKGETKRTKLISRTPGYHGNTLYALSASSRAHYKKVYGPLLSTVPTVSTPYEYRSPVDNYSTEGADYYAHELEQKILEEDPETIFAFILEPVSGSSTGASVPPPYYLKKVREICDKYGILIIADEVLCGAGRTGKFFASEHQSFHPDICVLGKSINGGYIPTSAVLLKSSDADLIHSHTGYFVHAQTYMQAPSVAATGLAVLNYLEKYKILERAIPVAEYFQSELRKNLLELDHVGSVQGIGHLAGVEFVLDKDSKNPFDRSQKVAERFIQEAQDKGLIFWPNTGHADGVNGDLIMLAPPLNVSESELAEVIDRLKGVIKDFKF